MSDEAVTGDACTRVISWPCRIWNTLLMPYFYALKQRDISSSYPSQMITQRTSPNCSWCTTRASNEVSLRHLCEYWVRCCNALTLHHDILEKHAKKNDALSFQNPLARLSNSICCESEIKSLPLAASWGKITNINGCCFMEWFWRVRCLFWKNRIKLATHM